MNALQARFQSLNPRERVIVIAGACLVVLAAVYLLALAPFYAAVEARGRRVADKQADLAWLQASLAEVQTLAASQPQLSGPTGESLVVLIDRTAREANLGSSLTGQTPSGDTGIRVRLESAPFDAVVTWLGTLQQQYAVSIETATIDRTSAPGLVNATLTLLRAGGG
jgi:general secretion pathway protein M